MASRTYEECCPIAHGLDLVGERWALLVIRELMFGPRRFTDIQTRLSGASSSVLTDRLHHLTAVGIVVRHRLPPPAASWVYELTEWGQGLQPTMLALARWARPSPLRDRSLPMTPAATAMAMLVHFDADKAAGVDADIDLDLGGDRFRATVRDRAMEITPPRESHAPSLIRVDEDNLKALVGPRRPASARGWAALGVRLEGDTAAALEVLRTLAA
jgi:DNA-binding HxlR family transcriptional regulator